MRARGARHQLDREGGDTFAGNFGDGLHRAERAKKTDKHLVAMKQRKIGFAGAIVGAVAKNLREDVGGTKTLGAIRQDFRTLGNVIRVRITGFDPRPSLNDDFQARLRQRGQHRGHNRHGSPGKVSRGTPTIMKLPPIRRTKPDSDSDSGRAGLYTGLARNRRTCEPRYSAAASLPGMK